MSVDDQISSAIGAHGLWKGRLLAAIESGTSDLSINVVGDDRQCSFGKWLHGADLDAGIRRSKHHGVCADLHRRFHSAAAEVFSLAMAGKKQDAFKALSANEEFSNASLHLVRALMAWKAAGGKD